MLASTEKPPPESGRNRRAGPTRRTDGRAGSNRVGQNNMPPCPPVIHPPVGSAPSACLCDVDLLGGTNNTGLAAPLWGSEAVPNSSPLITSKKLSQDRS